MIPKIIHFVWLGNSKKTKLVKRCIKSWKKYCPEYKIIEWNNKCFNEIDNIYANEAFREKKWAFASDYIRLYALKKYGGFYFDSDLELTNNIDCFLNHKFISGFENWFGRISPITAFMGAEKNNDIISELLKDYDNIHFKIDNKLDLTPNTIRITKFFIRTYKYNIKNNGLKPFVLKPNCVIYPYYYFCTPNIKLINYSIHRFTWTWTSNKSNNSIIKKCIKTIVKANLNILKNIINYSYKLNKKNKLNILNLKFSKITNNKKIEKTELKNRCFIITNNHNIDISIANKLKFEDIITINSRENCKDAKFNILSGDTLFNSFPVDSIKFKTDFFNKIINSSENSKFYISTSLIDDSNYLKLKLKNNISFFSSSDLVDELMYGDDVKSFDLIPLYKDPLLIAIHFAIFAGYKEIYLIGDNLNDFYNITTNKRFNNDNKINWTDFTNNNYTTISKLYNYSIMFKQLENIVNFACLKNIKIYKTSLSPIDCIPYKNFDDLF